MRRYRKLEVYAFDPTPLSVEWIKRQRLPERFHFYPKGIGAKRGIEKMYLPESHGVSYTIYDWDASSKDCVDVQMETIEHIMLENHHTFVDILKLDIEGSEFSVIRSLDFNKIEFGQIVVEFHDRFIENGKAELNKTVDVLRENGYYCFAVSPDFEYSFLNRKIYNALFSGRG